MRGACSQAKNTVPLSRLPTMRCSVAHGAFFTRTASRRLLSMVGISGSCLHSLLEVIERDHQFELSFPRLAP